jgi:hypothetical protein
MGGEREKNEVEKKGEIITKKNSFKKCIRNNNLYSRVRRYGTRRHRDDH